MPDKKEKERRSKLVEKLAVKIEETYLQWLQVSCRILTTRFDFLGVELTEKVSIILPD